MTTLLGIGCDIVLVDRIVRMAQRNPNIFLERVLGEQERVSLGARQDWRRCARHVAAKEALFKALGTGLIGEMRWTDVQVIYEKRTLRLLISGATYTHMAAIGGTETVLSMASDGANAIATVLLMGEPILQATPSKVN